MMVAQPSEGSCTLARKVIVAGGAGFLGSHLCDRLLADGLRVVCVDNFSTGCRENIAHILDHEQFSLVEHDINDPLHIRAKSIYNLACPASPSQYQADPLQTIKTNVNGSINLLELALNTGARILQASTSEVYGDALECPQRESYQGNVNPTGPRACYDEGKRCAETLYFDYWRTRSVQVRVARIFNTYGPRLRPDDGRVISNFIVQAITGEPITIYGDGSQTRSFCYVDDLIDGLVRFMDAPASGPGPLNLGNPAEIRIIELARSILRLTRSRSKIVHCALPQDDPRRRCPEIGKAEKAIGWKPRISLERGLECTIEYFEERLRRALVGSEKIGAAMETRETDNGVRAGLVLEQRSQACL
jgi:UDP-glucuronate decarboxylase